MVSLNLEAKTRLATYGSLSPGRENHGQLAGLRGVWRQGTVRGKLIPEGWGASLGYPGLILDSHEPLVDVHLFESPDLPEHWLRLDEFEGSGYRRVVTSIQTSEGELDACIYVLAEEVEPAAQ
jgi:gamma-glutamylcyclotransferase (GGCT)/AIG2-like uncharacterized protein YtfP